MSAEELQSVVEPLDEVIGHVRGPKCSTGSDVPEILRALGS
jgi:hypothetical protein